MSDPGTVEYWQQRWNMGEINFHREDVNPILSHNLGRLRLRPRSRIFVPLCGKTVDIRWLLSQGYDVCGIEYAHIAVDELFYDLGLTPTKESVGELIQVSAPHLKIWVGDYFKLKKEVLGTVHAVYDRGSLIALPHAVRVKYAQQMLTLLGTTPAPQLLVTLDVDRPNDEGPPHYVGQKEIQAHYASAYSSIQLVEKIETGAVGWILEP